MVDGRAFAVDRHFDRMSADAAALELECAYALEEINVVLERLRATKRDAGRHVSGDDEEVFGSHASAGDLETRMDLETALASLPQGARTVFVLHDMEGYSHDEIAQMTGIAAGTARAQLWRARRALMKRMAP